MTTHFSGVNSSDQRSMKQTTSGQRCFRHHPIVSVDNIGLIVRRELLCRSYQCSFEAIDPAGDIVAAELKLRALAQDSNDSNAIRFLDPSVFFSLGENRDLVTGICLRAGEGRNVAAQAAIDQRRIFP